MKALRISAYTLLACLIPAVAFADAGLPMIMVGYPFVAALLVPVVLIESFIFAKKTNVGFKRNILALSVANACSTLLGYPLAWLFQVLIQFGLSWLFVKLNVSPESPFFNNSIVGAFGFALGSAWLPPVEGSLWWMLPAAGIVGLVPAFFVSIYSEYWITKKILKEPVADLKKAVIRANLGSYGFLLLVILGILVWNYFSVRLK